LLSVLLVKVPSCPLFLRFRIGKIVVVPYADHALRFPCSGHLYALVLMTGLLMFMFSTVCPSPWCLPLAVTGGRILLHEVLPSDIFSRLFKVMVLAHLFSSPGWKFFTPRKVRFK